MAKSTALSILGFIFNKISVVGAFDGSQTIVALGAQPRKFFIDQMMIINMRFRIFAIVNIKVID